MGKIAWTSLVLAFVSSAALAQQTVAPHYKMTTPIPPSITTPDSVDTSIGTLKFFDGVPTRETAAKAYDQLDLVRGIETFLNGIPGASLVAMRQGYRDAGAVDGTVGIFQELRAASFSSCRRTTRVPCRQATSSSGRRPSAISSSAAASW